MSIYVRLYSLHVHSFAYRPTCTMYMPIYVRLDAFTYGNRELSLTIIAYYTCTFNYHYRHSNNIYKFTVLSAVASRNRTSFKKFCSSETFAIIDAALSIMGNTKCRMCSAENNSCVSDYNAINCEYMYVKTWSTHVLIACTNCDSLQKLTEDKTSVFKEPSNFKGMTQVTRKNITVFVNVCLRTDAISFENYVFLEILNHQRDMYTLWREIAWLVLKILDLQFFLDPRSLFHRNFTSLH